MLAQLRHLSALSVDVTFDTSPPDLSRVPGVIAVEVEGNWVRCQVTGSVEPLLGVLTAKGRAPAAQPRTVAGRAVPGHYGREPAGGGAPCGLRPVPLAVAPRPPL